MKGQEYDNHWLLGYEDKFIRFESGESYGKFKISFSPVFDTIPIFDSIPRCSMGFTTACISNSQGELIFFTDGHSIFGKKYKITKNGDTINPGRMWGPSFGYGYPQQNGAIFLPFPGHPGLYYLFHKGVTFIDHHYIKDRIDARFCDKFYYSVLKDDAENGEVINKNVVLLNLNPKDSTSELINDSEMAACLHGNGRDFWIVIKGMGTNKYFFYLLDPSGVKLHHTQNIGIAKSKNDWNGNSVFSKDGKYFARTITQDGLEVFEFDRCNGFFSFPRYAAFPDTTLTVGSVAFSPSGRFVYLTSLNAIWQYDLSEANFAHSKIMVDTWDSIRSPVDQQMYYLGFFQARLAPDDRIYIAYFGGNHFLHLIAKPDEKGIACQSENYAVILPAYMSGSLPMFPNFKLEPLPDCTTGLEEIASNENIDFLKIYDRIIIYNLQGQLIANLKCSSVSEFRNNGVLSSGIYFLNLWNNGEGVTYIKVHLF